MHRHALLLIPVLLALAAPAACDVDPATVASLTAAARADRFASRILMELTDDIGPRLAGSAGMQRARAWASTVLLEAGCDAVWEEPVTVPRWERGHEWARMTSPYAADLPMLGLGMSVGTPPEGVEAEVLAVCSFEELSARAAEVPGKIVLFAVPWEGYGPNVKFRSQGASAAAKLGAVACLIRPAGFGQNTPHTGVMRYEDGVAQIPAASLTPEDAGRLRRLCERGKHPRVRLMMEARTLGDGPCANMFGELRGREKPEEIVLIAAHLDAWDVGGGAHDDGGACVMMVAALKLLHDLGLQPRRTVRVGLFTSEEYGGQGGHAYLEAHRDEAALHVAALESDGGCFAPQGFSVRGSETMIARVAELAAPLHALGADTVEVGGGGVDIGPMVETGVPGFGLRTHNEEYFRYHHSSADTYDKVSLDDLATNVAAIAALVLAIADDPVSLRELSAGRAEAQR
jgi:carboxypeptidase Q